MDEEAESVESVLVRSCEGREEPEDEELSVGDAEAREVRGWTGRVATERADETEPRRNGSLDDEAVTGEARENEAVLTLLGEEEREAEATRERGGEGEAESWARAGSAVMVRGAR